MDEQAPISRRTFIVVSALSAASAGCAVGCARFQPAAALSPEERRLVEAVADQIIPPDDTPGGKEAGVAEYVDRQLCGPYQRFLADYRNGLEKIDRTSRRLHQQAFADLPFPRQTALLEAIEAGKVPDGIWKPNEAGQFFRLVSDHCLQGFYGSPRHGGNRDFVSWRMIGLDNPQIVGRIVVP
jgi:gluconate 2-dehydrogenase gamma chain